VAFETSQRSVPKSWTHLKEKFSAKNEGQWSQMLRPFVFCLQC
jgi:hypothetical protein